VVDKIFIGVKGVKEKEIYDVDISDVNQEGQGIGRINGFVVFVGGVLPGEKVKIEITKLDKSYATGRIIKIIKSSIDRIEPFCNSYRKCGGCGFQHMSYEAQLKWKKSIVENALKRIGGLGGRDGQGEKGEQGGLGGQGEIEVNNTIGMAVPFKYRNKAQFPVGYLSKTQEAGKLGTLSIEEAARTGASGNTTEAITAGFYSARSHDIIDIGVCGIHDDYANKVKDIVKEFLNEKRITVYSEKTGKGLVRHIVTRTGTVTDEVMVVLVINGNEFPSMNELISRLCQELPIIKSIVLNVNTRKTNVIFGDKNIIVYGDGYITDYIDKYKFKLSPLSFYQVNHMQAEVLYAKTLEYAGLTGTETVFDLYCGVGTISLYVSQQAKKVYGVEVVGAAIADAKANAKANGINNVEFIEGKAEEVIPRLYKKGITADVVIVDPPRKGCDQHLLDTILKMVPTRIIYVSCNPTTLARDLKYLCANGKSKETREEEPGVPEVGKVAGAETGSRYPTYTIQEVQPVDMFPWTGHVETVVLLTHKKADSHIEIMMEFN
jgi:23S rRNA (uracil1939-C5)-methyltransferase